MSRSGIVNVRMVITEEKILSNIDKIQKLINPNSKKKIVQLEEDTYFKDLIESVKAYLIEYPKKKNFPASVYKAAYGLVEYATNQFEENTKKIEELIRQREQNIILAGKLKDLIDVAENREEGWEDTVSDAEDSFPEDIIETLNILGTETDTESENYESALKLLNARVNNLETNLHIEIDMERIEDRSKALSYIGIEVADALKGIPVPEEPLEEIGAEESAMVESIIQEPVGAVNPILPGVENIQQEQNRVQAQQFNEQQQYFEQTTFEAKPSLWQRIKNSKIIRTLRYITKIRIRIDYSALPEGRGENIQ